MSEETRMIINRKPRSKAPDDEQLLSEYVSMTAKEIGEKYGAAESTVRGWIQAARKRVKERIDSETD